MKHDETEQVDYSKARYYAIYSLGYGRGFTAEEAKENYYESVANDMPKTRTKDEWMSYLMQNSQQVVWRSPEGAQGFVKVGSTIRWMISDGLVSATDEQVVDNPYDPRFSNPKPCPTGPVPDADALTGYSVQPRFRVLLTKTSNPYLMERLPMTGTIHIQEFDIHGCPMRALFMPDPEPNGNTAFVGAPDAVFEIRTR